MKALWFAGLHQTLLFVCWNEYSSAISSHSAFIGLSRFMFVLICYHRHTCLFFCRFCGVCVFFSRFWSLFEARRCATILLVWPSSTLKTVKSKEVIHCLYIYLYHHHFSYINLFFLPISRVSTRTAFGNGREYGEYMRCLVYCVCSSNQELLRHWNCGSDDSPKRSRGNSLWGGSRYFKKNGGLRWLQPPLHLVCVEVFTWRTGQDACHSSCGPLGAVAFSLAHHRTCIHW